MERLLRLRAQSERAARRDLAEAMAEVRKIESSLAILEGSLQSCRGEIAAARPVAELAKALEAGLLHSRNRARDELLKAENRAELSRATYRERRRDLTTLSRLRERRHSAWRIETEREAQAEMDEMARVRYVNMQREGVGK